MTSEGSKNPPLSIQLFGQMTVHINGSPLPPLRSKKGLWLLAFLALHADQDVSRERIAASLWPDSSDALATLRRTLTDLRAALLDSSARLRAPSPRTLRLCIAPSEVDVLTFRSLAQADDLASVERAITLSNAPLLQDCMENWVVQDRAMDSETRLRLLEKAASIHLDQNNPRQAAAYLRLAVQADPYRESLYRALMEALIADQEPAEAMQVYRELRVWLLDQVRSEPSAETTSLYDSIRASSKNKVDRSCPIPERSPTAETARAPLDNLPLPLTDLIGRQDEMERLKQNLLSNRLVTLSGPGGIGKTRLAIQCALDLRGDFSQGAWFVDLAALSDPASVPQAVASVLQVREEAGRPIIKTLADSLRSRSLLLVLDNCEHLIEASAEVASALLLECPHLQIIATSRQALRLTGEVVLPVPALSHPPSRYAVPENLGRGAERYPAIRLFVERAAAVQPAFTVSEGNLPAIVEICERLDGIPLAIELAAARTRVLTPEQIAHRMSDRFRLLTGGSRTAQPRQQTLQTLIDWSYEILTDREKALLRCLSIFSGGWTLEAAERVGSRQEEAGSPVSHSHGDLILDLLHQLAEKSLILANEETASGRRYRMLETIREYAGAKLAESGEFESVSRSHRDYYAALADETDRKMHGLEQNNALLTLDVEYDNIRAVFRCCLQDNDSLRVGLVLAASMQMYWSIRGRITEGRELLAELLGRPASVNYPYERAFGLNTAGVLAWFQGDLQQAISHLEESLSIRRAAGNKRECAIVLGNLGSVYRDKKDFPRSRVYQEDSLRELREMNLPWNVACALTNLGSAALHQGDLAYARECYDEAVSIRRDLCDLRGVAISLCGLGQTYFELNELDKALRCYNEALILLRQVDDKLNLTITLTSLGSLLSKQGNYCPAKEALTEALLICGETGDSMTIDVLGQLAQVCYGQKSLRQAVILLNAARSYAAVHGIVIDQDDRQKQDDMVAEIRLTMGNEPFESACREGGTMNLVQAIASVGML